MMKRPGIRRMRQPRVDMQSMQAQLIALQARVTAQADELAALKGSETAPASAQKLSHAHQRTNRRALLQTAGVAAAAAVAGTIATHPTAALANDGQNMIIGTTNVAESPTHLNRDTGVTTSPSPLLFIDNSSSTTPVNGVVVNTSGGGTGLIGNAAIGTAGNGVVGSASGPLATGVFGEGTGDPTAAGIFGTSDIGYGIFANSGSGVGLLVDGGSSVGGRIWQHIGTNSGIPTSGSYSVGEQLRDINGDMFLCVVAGSPGTWKKVAASPIGYASGALVYLSSPIRLLDTRVGATDAAYTINHRIDSSTPYTLQVTGTVVGNISVPSGAVGVIGNITVVNTQGYGYLTLYPAGGNRPGTSNINYTASGQVVSNSFNSVLSADGKLTIACGGAGTDVIIDVASFIM